MTDINLEKICQEVMEVAHYTGDFILSEREKFTATSVEAKGKHNFVTHVDTEAEQMLVGGLGKLIPGSGFIAEEGTAGQSGEDYQWIIDPVDAWIQGIFLCLERKQSLYGWQRNTGQQYLQGQ
jgi:myo-inositol-1(or 4)-monophosphatase